MVSVNELSIYVNIDRHICVTLATPLDISYMFVFLFLLYCLFVYKYMTIKLYTLI